MTKEGREGRLAGASWDLSVYVVEVTESLPLHLSLLLTYQNIQRDVCVI